MIGDPLIVHVSAQCAVFFRAGLCGAALALLCDFFRILRRAFRCPVALVAAQDIFCCTVFALGSFFFLLAECDGRLRWFALAGQLLGAVLYWGLFGEYVVGAGAWALGLLKGVVLFLFGLLRSGFLFLQGLLLGGFRVVMGLLRGAITILGGLISPWFGKIRVSAVARGKKFRKILKKDVQINQIRLKPYAVLLYNFKKAKLGGKSIPNKKRNNGR